MKQIFNFKSFKALLNKQWTNIGIAFLLSLLAHTVIIYRFITGGTLFTGKGDGIAQMLPFQMYLYEKFTHLNFFYSMDFGIGGDFFRSLSYYYATTPISYINFLMVYLLDLVLPFDTSNVEFWAVNQIFVSVFKLTAILFVMYKLLRYLGINRWTSFIGSFLYGYSTVYFFFTFTWSFFSDVMLYLPLTIYGLERYCHEKKIGIFILAIALTLHSNFYFSYYEFIFVLLYFLFRVIYNKPSDIVTRKNKLIVFTVAATLGLMVSAVGFYTGVSSYLMNDRTLPPIKLKPFIDFIIHFNLFYDGYYVIIPFITVMALMTFRLYRNYTFRLFAALTLFFMAGSLSPWFDSFFNGFSIDQRRWVYMLVFTSAVVVAIYLENLSKLTVKELLISLIPVIIIYPLTAVTINKWLLWLLFIPIIVGAILLYQKYQTKRTFHTLHILIILMNLVFVYDYMTQQIDTLHPLDERNLDYLRSDKYNSDVQQQMINKVTKKHPDERIDWQASATYNTPMYQHFSGIKLYSSIFDKDIYQFYDKDLNVTMDTDSNSIYYRLGERANLYSLFNVNHSLRTTNLSTLPFGFTQVDKMQGQAQTYTMFENTHPLDTVRVTSKVFAANDITTPIDREHAMLEGVVLETDHANSKVKPTKNIMGNASASYKDATMDVNTMTVNKEQGGIIIHLNKEDIKHAKDIYIDMNVVLLNPSKYHYVWANEIYQSRKPLDDNYRRYNPRITLRVKKAEDITIRFMTGTYQLSINGIYTEDYKTLEKASKARAGHTLKQDGSRIIADLKPHEEGYAVIPTPYLKGMKAKVDGKTAEIQEGNYLMTAVRVPKDAKQVVVTYTPPYFHWMQVISIIGIILSVFFAVNVYRRRWFKEEIKGITNKEEIRLLDDY